MFSEKEAKKEIPFWIKKQIPNFMKQNYFNSSLGKIHYLSGGRGTQNIVLLHGNPTWSFLWRKVIKEIGENDFQLIAPDLMNLGHSDSLSAKDFSMESHVQAFTEFFKAIDIQNAVFVIQDWGGPIAISALKRSQVKIKGLVILNTGLRPPAPPFKVSKFHSFVNKRIIPEILFNILRYPMYSLHSVQVQKDSINKNAAKAYRYPMKINSQWKSALQFARMVPNNENHPSYPFFQETEEYCRQFNGNVQIVWGMSDPILGRGLKKMTEIFQDYEVKELRAGHFIQEEFPKEIAIAIKNASNGTTS